MKVFACLVSTSVLIPWLAGAQSKPKPPRPAPVPAYNPARQPVVTGEVPVGLIVVTFKETAVPNTFAAAMDSLRTIASVSQEEYFKIYSNGIAWPKLHVMPADGVIYKAPQFYGYYCEYDYWKNPLGWKTIEDGTRRASQMKNDALRFASKDFRGTKPRFICHNYVTSRPATPSKELTAELANYYQGNRNGGGESHRPRPPRKTKAKANEPTDLNFDPWGYYSPDCRWGDPLWPNSSIQIQDFSSGTFAHELGHALTAESFGWPTELVMYFGGGLAISRRNRGDTPWRAILVSLMGPCAGFMLWGLVFLVKHLMGLNHNLHAMDNDESGNDYRFYLLSAVGFLSFMNLYWGLFNLLPVLPLDGGYILESFCEAMRFRDPSGLALKVGAIVSGAAAYYLFTKMQQPFAGALMLMLCMQSVGALQTKR